MYLVMCYKQGCQGAGLQFYQEECAKLDPEILSEKKFSRSCSKTDGQSVTRGHYEKVKTTGRFGRFNHPK